MNDKPREKGAGVAVKITINNWHANGIDEWVGPGNFIGSFLLGKLVDAHLARAGVRVNGHAEGYGMLSDAIILVPCEDPEAAMPFILCTLVETGLIQSASLAWILAGDQVWRMGHAAAGPFDPDREADRIANVRQDFKAYCKDLLAAQKEAGGEPK